MEDYSSKYTGQQVEDLLDQVASGNAGGGGGGITEETDPIFSASPAASITEDDKEAWNNKVSYSAKDLKVVNADGFMTSEGDGFVFPNTPAAQAGHGVVLATLDDIPNEIPIETYIADFTMESLKNGMNNSKQVDCDMQALITALNSNKVILVRESEDSSYKGAHVLNGYAEDLLYFSIVDSGGSVLWCEGTNLGDQYIDGRMLHMRYWKDKQDTISDLAAIREGAAKGATAVQTYIVDFDILELESGEDIPNIRTDLLIEAIETHKLILIPFDKEYPLMGYLPVSAYYEDYIYLGISNGARHIDVSVVMDRQTISANDIKVFNLFNTQDRLVSGSNIKTINGQSILGSGDITISGGKKIVPNKQEATSFSFTYDSENGPLEPNKIYICHNTEILNVIISDIIPPEDLYGEYTCLFKFGGVSVDSLGLTLPDYVLWANGTAPQLEVQTPYELSITATKFIDDYIYKAVLTPFISIE